MKKLVTFRLHPDLLAKARRAAQRENRTLTNFVETALKKATDRPEAQTETKAAKTVGDRPQRKRHSLETGATD